MSIVQKVESCFGKKPKFCLHELKWIYKPNVKHIYTCHEHHHHPLFASLLTPI